MMFPGLISADKMACLKKKSTTKIWFLKKIGQRSMCLFFQYQIENSSYIIVVLDKSSNMKLYEYL